MSLSGSRSRRAGKESPEAPAHRQWRMATTVEELERAMRQTRLNMMKFVRVYTEPRETSADEHGEHENWADEHGEYENWADDEPYGGFRGRFNPGGGLGFGGPGNGGALAFR